nr:hypothetical protein [Tanacetum cinerariifolium]GEZ59343.1 hypothetical protein [Tanacetum cinerariifolium]
LQKIGRNLGVKWTETIGFEKTKWNAIIATEEVIFPGNVGLLSIKTTGTKRHLEGLLLDSLQSDKSKTGLGCDSQGFDSQVLENQVNDKYNSGEGYHAVPPPYTGNYMPPKPDLVFADEHVVSESITSLAGIAKSKVKTSESKLKTVSDLTIEEWVSDDEEEDVS